MPRRHWSQLLFVFKLVAIIEMLLDFNFVLCMSFGNHYFVVS